jgi:putative two-component system response regulator
MTQANPGPQPVILAIDDAEDIRTLVAAILGKDCIVRTAPDGPSGIKSALSEPKPDVILLDVEMGVMNGFDVCRMLKANPATAAIPVLFLTSRQEEEFEAEGFSVGAVDYIPKPINTVLLRARVRTHLALANQQVELETMVRERTTQLERARTQVLRRLALAMEYHESAPSSNRGLRVGLYAKLIAEAAGARPAMIEMLIRTAPLYDLGKIGVPSEVMRKKGKLSAPDWEQVRRYPLLGGEMIGEHADPLLQLARVIAMTHHERWDGSGYPKGLKGEEIPWPGRLMGIVDSFESMTTTQFYREALPFEEAARQILAGGGTKYDPKLMEPFRKALPAMQKVRQAITDKLGERVNIDLYRDADATPSAPKAAPARPSAAPQPAATKTAPRPATPPQPAASGAKPAAPAVPGKTAAHPGAPGAQRAPSPGPQAKPPGATPKTPPKRGS